MLIVAMPKTASTSLLDTIGSAHDIEHVQWLYRRASCPADTRILHEYHRDIRELTSKQAERFAAKNRLNKQHIPPTENNLALLRGVKKVILIREPNDVVEAYCRAEAKRIHRPRAEFSACVTPGDWVERAKELGLTHDLEWFRDGWVREARHYPDMNLVLTYEEVVKDTQRVVNTIESFWGLPISTRVKLAKRRYSRATRWVDLRDRVDRATRAVAERMLAALRKNVSR